MNEDAGAAAELYQHVQQFYAQQMQLLDDGRVELWADTFTEDGVFAANAQPAPVVGRGAIAAAARQATEQFEARGIRRRHWLGMVSIEKADATAVTARCYALVIETPRGGAPAIRASTLCEDVLRRVSGGGFLVHDRRISRDDLG